MAELTNLEEKLAEVTGLAMAAQAAGGKVTKLTEDADKDLVPTLQRMAKEAAQTEERCTELAGTFEGKKTAILDEARDAVGRARTSLVEAEMLVVGEPHGVHETPGVLYSLATVLDTRAGRAATSTTSQARCREPRSPWRCQRRPLPSCPAPRARSQLDRFRLPRSLDPPAKQARNPPRVSPRT